MFRKVNTVYRESEDGKPPKRWSLTVLISIFTFLIGVFLMFFFRAANKEEVKVSASTKTVIEKAILDTLQNRELLQVHCSLNAVNIRQDKTDSKVNNLELNQTKSLEKQDKQNTALILFFTKWDKTLLPALLERNSEMMSLDSMTDSHYEKTFNHNDTLTVDNSVNDIYNFGEGGARVYDEIFKDSYQSPFPKKSNPLQYILFLNLNLKP